MKIIPMELKEFNGIDGYSLFANLIDEDPDTKFYYISDDNKNVFLSISKNNCVFYSIEDKKHFSFLLKEDGSLSQIFVDGVYFVFSKDGITLKSSNTESSLFYIYDGENQANGYDGRAIYAQYNSDSDINCYLEFPHMYKGSDENNRSRLYDINLKAFSCAIIDHNYSKTNTFEYGFTFNKHEHYHRREYDPDCLLYDYLNNGDNKRLIVKYVKAVYVSPSGPILIPMFGLKEEEEVRERILELGFNVEVPKLLLDLYNNKVDFVNYLNLLLSNLKEQGLILSKKNLS